MQARRDSCTVTEASRGKAGLWAEVGRGAGGGGEALNSFRRPGSILRPRSPSLSPFLPTSLHHPAPSFTLPHLCGRAPVTRCYPDLLCLSSPSPTVSPLALPWGDPPRPTALQPYSPVYGSTQMNLFISISFSKPTCCETCLYFPVGSALCSSVSLSLTPTSP